MEDIKTIVKGTIAKFDHFYNGIITYRIETENHAYLLDINVNDSEWKDTFLYPEFKAITLMRWIRKGLEKNDGSFLLVK